MYWHLPTSYKLKVTDLGSKNSAEFSTKQANSSFNSFASPEIPEKNLLVSAYSPDGKLLCDKQLRIHKGLNFLSFSIDQCKEEAKSDRIGSLKGLSFEIKFDQSSHALRPDAKMLLDSIASLLKAHSEIKIILTGHSDNIGDYKKNMTLSEYRSRVSANYIENKGINSSRITKRWLGSSNLVSELERSKNRRVILELK